MSPNLFAICLTTVTVALIHSLGNFAVEFQKGDNVRDVLRAQTQQEQMLEENRRQLDQLTRRETGRPLVKPESKFKL